MNLPCLLEKHGVDDHTTLAYSRKLYGVQSVPKICWSISVQRVVVEMHPAPTEGAFGTEGDPLEGAFGTQRVPH